MIVRDLTARPGIGRIDLSWRSHLPLVDHFAVYASPDRTVDAAGTAAVRRRCCVRRQWSP